MQKSHKSIRIFKSPLLEKLTHVHPITPLVVWVPVISWLIWRSIAVSQMSVGMVLVVGGSGIFTWTLAEYVLHRWVFHFNPEGQLQERLQFLMHGLHHEDPIDPTRLVMPPSLGIILAVILYSFFGLFLGAVYVQPFFAFFLIGYLCYDYIHFSVHHFQQRTAIGRFLKQSHMLHHYATQNARWGVSSPIWDYVFGTLDEKKKEQTT